METKLVQTFRRSMNGDPLRITLSVPKDSDKTNGKDLDMKKVVSIEHLYKKDVIKTEFFDKGVKFKTIYSDKGRLPRKEKKRIKKGLGLQGKSRARMIRKSVHQKTGNFAIRINKK